MEIRVDNASSPEVRRFVREHLEDLAARSPPESNHGLGVAELRSPWVTFWTAWSDRGELLGCVALKQLDSKHAEIKSMRTAPSHRREGVATKLLERALDEAKGKGYRRVSLETGSMDSFAPARSLYAKFGFKESAPFDGYTDDPNSCFMTKELP